MPFVPTKALAGIARDLEGAMATFEASFEKTRDEIFEEDGFFKEQLDGKTFPEKIAELVKAEAPCAEDLSPLSGLMAAFRLSVLKFWLEAYVVLFRLLRRCYTIKRHLALADFIGNRIFNGACSRIRAYGLAGAINDRQACRLLRGWADVRASMFFEVLSLHGGCMLAALKGAGTSEGT